MILARVVGTVVATRKDPRLEGHKLLIIKPVSPSPDGELKDEAGYIVSVDTVSAGNRELVIAVSGSSARMADGCKDKPVDNAIIGIVDSLSMDPVPEVSAAPSKPTVPSTPAAPKQGKKP